MLILCLIWYIMSFGKHLVNESEGSPDGIWGLHIWYTCFLHLVWKKNTLKIRIKFHFSFLKQLGKRLKVNWGFVPVWSR